MPKKKRDASYKVDANKKIVYRYNGMTPTAEEIEDINTYVNAGYIIKRIDRSITVSEMRAELNADEAALTEFERLYKLKTVTNDKGKQEAGFHAAAKFYNDWKKKKVAAEKTKGKKAKEE